MNKKQRYVLYACAAIILLMLLFRPFHSPDGQEYEYLLNPYPGWTVDIGMLLVQWLGIILASAILWFAFRDGKEEAQKLPLRYPNAGEKRQSHLE